MLQKESSQQETNFYNSIHIKNILFNNDNTYNDTIDWWVQKGSGWCGLIKTGIAGALWKKPLFSSGRQFADVCMYYLKCTK